MTKTKVVWRIVLAVIYLAIAVGVVSAGKSGFETLVLAALVQLYAAILYNFSVIGAATDVNNYAGFVRFRVLAAAQGQTGDEAGKYSEQENALQNAIKGNSMKQRIDQFSHGIVSVYAIFKIITAVVAG